jgi:TetR/AcrR family transcriptional regulator
MWSIAFSLHRKETNIIFTKFLNLKPEKKERILNAAIKEFALKGFDNASTNEIIKDADISKGLLFHYFNNKKALFLFLYDYTIDIYVNEFFEKIDLNEKDIFTRLRNTVLIKFELIKKYPDMFNFIKIAYFDESHEIKKDLELRNKQSVASNTRKIFENIDISKFKEGIDIGKAIEIIIWTLEGFGARAQAEVRLLPVNEINYEKATEELDIYLELLKNSFYKGGF